MSDGPTTVEEWLAEGNTITRKRPEVVYKTKVGEVEYQFTNDETSSARWRCKVTDVYGYRDPMGHLKPHICREAGCTRGGKVKKGRWFWCREHV